MKDSIYKIKWRIFQLKEKKLIVKIILTVI